MCGSNGSDRREGQSVGNTEILVAIRLSSRFAMWAYNSSSNDWPTDYSFKAHVMFNINGLQCVGVHYREILKRRACSIREPVDSAVIMGYTER